MSLTVVAAHAAFSEARRDLLSTVVDSWQGGIQAVVEDHHRSGSWRTVRAAWHEALRLSDGHGHLLVAQDDMVMARGGYDLVAGLCERNPGAVMSFRWPECDEKWLHQWTVGSNQHWARSFYTWSGGCTAVPAPLVADFLEWAQRFDQLINSRYVNHDDTRADLHLISRGVETLRCRWSLLRHLGKWSECRRAERDGDDPELGLITDTIDLPALDDPRWDTSSDSIRSAVHIPPEFSRTVQVLLGDRAEQVGLAGVRDAHNAVRMV